MNTAKRWRDGKTAEFGGGGGKAGNFSHLAPNLCVSPPLSSSIAPVARLTALVSLVLVVLVTQPSTCHRDDEGEERAEALAVQLSVGAQATPTPLWAVVWGPTQPLEDETYHLLSSQETERLRQQHGSQREEAGTAAASSDDWLYPDASTPPREDARPESRNREGAEDGRAEEAELEEGGWGEGENDAPPHCQECSWELTVTRVKVDPRSTSVPPPPSERSRPRLEKPHQVAIA